MSMNIAELQSIFEYELKRKLAQRSRSPQEELRKLISAFKFFDYESSFILDKNQWIKGVLRTGLCGFNINDLITVFDRYDPNKTGYINYLNFSNHIYGKEELIPLSADFENNKLSIGRNKEIIKENKPPGLYERNYNQNQMSHYNISESLYNDFNENKNIGQINNSNNNSNLNSTNSTNIKSEDLNVPKQSNYHMNKPQSQPQIMNNNNTNVNNVNESKNNSEINNNQINNNQNKNEIIDNNININISNNQRNNSSNNDSNKNTENKNYFQKLLNIIRNKININNGLAFYTFAHGLKSLEDKSTNSTSIENFISVIEQMELQINQDDLINFYSILDFNQSNKVSTDEILRLIKGEIPEERKMLIVSKFSLMDKEKTGIIPIALVKDVYNFKFHPDAFLGKKTCEEIYKEFLYTFDIFCELKGLKEEISYKDFIDYYTPISASILNDNYFDDIIYGVWNMEEYNNNNAGNNMGNAGNNISNTGNSDNSGNNIQIEKRNNFQINNLSKSQIINQDIQMRAFSPKKEQEQNEIKRQRMTPYYNPRVSPEGKGLKMFRQLRFNPITNEYIMSPITPEKNPNQIMQTNNRNYLPDTNNISSTTTTSNANNIIYNKNGFQKLDLLRELLAKRGQKSIFIIQRMFYIYDRNQTGEIPFDKLCDIFEIYNINITREDIFEFFNILDQEHKGIIKYNDLIQMLISNINKNRENLILKLFVSLSKNNEYTLINDLKQSFNPTNHPDFINKIKSKDEILLDFIDSLEIFREYNSNLNNENIKKGYMSIDDFMNFFKEISMSISDDRFFNFLIDKCFNSNLNQDKNNSYGNGYGNDNVRIRAGKQIVNNF